jgi:hypothetical protein
MPRVRGPTIALAALLMLASGAAAASAPVVSTDRGCYLVGQTVRVSGSGFAAGRAYDIAVDGVDFGGARTDASGTFTAHLVPGGLPADVAQSVDQVSASDGSSEAETEFTLTRSAGARFMASRGDPRGLRAPFQIWGFSLHGTVRSVYVHYVGPSGQPRETVRLGQTSGQCGYLLTPRTRFFPFSPSTGRWALQVDTQSRYASHPRGPVARIYVQIARG